MIDKVREHITEMMSDEACVNLDYHNLNHTRMVVESIGQLAIAEKISEQDIEHLEIAAWFHDAGYLANHENHEIVGAKMARDFLSKRSFDEERIRMVEILIAATKMDYQPEDCLQMIMKDADLSHLGSPDFMDITEALRKERIKDLDEKHSKLGWVKVNLKFLKEHTYYTDSANSLYNEDKKNNIRKLSLMKDELETKKAEQKEKQANKKNKSKKDNPIPEKGRETAYRVALRNHIQLSKIADNKANIMLSINALIMSIIISTVLPKVVGNSHLIAPVIVITLTCTLSIIFATLSTRPKVTHGHATKKDIEDKKANLLFFGNFHKMDYESFNWGMNRMMEDQKYLYDSMNKDLFFLGVVLHKKYRFLRFTYDIFMYGMILSIISFTVATLCL